MSGVLDLANLVGGVDVSQVETGIAFDLLDPTNPVFFLALPGLDEPIKLKGKDHKTFSDMIKGMDLSIDVEISTGDEDDPYNEVKIDFEKMSDFKKDQIIKNIAQLKRLQQLQEYAQIIARKAQKDDKFIKMLSDEEQKKDFLAFLEHNIELLK